MKNVALAALLVVAMGTPATAKPLTGPDAKAAFDRIAALAGDWVGPAGEGEMAGKEAHINYRVTAGGSAVIETLMAGTPQEMVTVYYLAGDSLQMTHYCMMKNQPHMIAKSGSPAGEVAFDFAPTSGIVATKDGHMHALRLVFTDADHLRAEWTWWEGGKAGETAKFQLTRVKAA